MSNIQGQRTTESIISDIQPLNFSDRIYDAEFGMNRENVNRDTMFRILYKLGKGLGRPSKWKKFQVAEDTMHKQITAIDTIAAPTDTSFTVTAGDGSLLLPGFLIYNINTGETMRVNAVATDTVTVTRDWGSALAGGASASTANDDNLRIVGMASAEGTGAPEAISNQPEAGYNYTSYVRTAVDASLHDINTETEVGKDWPWQRKKAMLQHIREVNNHLWFSTRHAQAVCPVFSKPVTTTGGLLQHLKAEYDVSTTYTGVLSQRCIDMIMERAFYRGSSEKWAFMGQHIGMGFSAIARNQIRVNDQDSKKYGINIQEYTAMGCTLKIVVDKEIFTGIGAASGYSGGTMSSKMAILDMEYIDLRHIQNMGTQLYRGVQLPGVSGKKDVWETTVGIEMSPSIDNTYNSDTAPDQYRPPHLLVTGLDTYDD